MQSVKKITRPTVGNTSMQAMFLAEKTSQFGPISTFPGWKEKGGTRPTQGCTHVCPTSPPHRHVVDGRHSIGREQ